MHVLCNLFTIIFSELFAVVERERLLRPSRQLSVLALPGSDVSRTLCKKAAQSKFFLYLKMV